jgi:hypothetical protein
VAVAGKGVNGVAQQAVGIDRVADDNKGGELIGVPIEKGRQFGGVDGLHAADLIGTDGESADGDGFCQVDFAGVVDVGGRIFPGEGGGVPIVEGFICQAIDGELAGGMREGKPRPEGVNVNVRDASSMLSADGPSSWLRSKRR